MHRAAPDDSARTDGITYLGQSSPAKPDLVHVLPMSTTIAETSSVGRQAGAAESEGERARALRPCAAKRVRLTAAVHAARAVGLRKGCAGLCDTLLGVAHMCVK